MAWHDGLTEKQRKFCEAFSSNGGNATAAARVAGYAKPEPQSVETLRNLKVLHAIEQLRQVTTKASIATREQRQSFWTEIMRNPEEQTRDRLKASELLAKPWRLPGQTRINRAVRIAPGATDYPCRVPL